MHSNQTGIEFSSNIIDHFQDKKWQLALEISNIGIWDFKSKINQVYFSKSSKAIIGFENDPHFGKNPSDWNDRVHPEDRDKYFKDFQDHLNGLINIYENIHRVEHKNGSYRWVLDRGQIVEKDKFGKPTRIIGTHTDVTEHVKNELKIKDTLNIVSEQNNKLQNFAHIVTHNLNQHAGNFETLLTFYKESKTEKEKEEYIDYLSTLSSSLTKTINSLKDIVSVQSNKKTKISKLYIGKEINTILKALDFVVTENKVTIYNKINPKFYIHFNSSYFESIIQNFLSNAIKYKHTERDPIVTISLELINYNLVLQIEDNGIGIDLDKYGSSIFGLYKTFHHNPEAEGVGLYLVKNQIEAYGGQIDVKSIINEGTTFIITIPNKKIQQ